jgi:LysM repeat protein
VKALFIIALALAIFGAAGYATYRLFIQPEQALKMEKLLPPPPPPPDPTAPEFQKCVAIRKSGKLVQARDAFYAFIEQYPESSKGAEAKDTLGEINAQIYLTQFPSPDKEVYVVKPGDVIDRVARHMKTSGEMILRANNLRANNNRGVILQIGQKLSIPRLDLSVVISRKQDRVIVLNRGRFFKWYPVVAWPPGLTKKPAAGKAAPPPVKQAGKVTEKMAWLNGQRITFADKGYAESTHWIQINIGHCTLHSIADEKAEGRPPGGGIVLSPKALEELTALLDKGDPVTLE